MKALLVLFATTLIIGTTSHAQEVILPELNVLKTAELDGSYSCGNSGSYGLRLTENSWMKTDYDLFINYACGSDMEFDSGLNGPSLSLMADLGSERLAYIDWFHSQTPKWQVGQSYDFRMAQKIVAKKTYSVIINTSSASGVMLVHVDKIEGTKVFISYVVKQYFDKYSRKSSSDFGYDITLKLKPNLPVIEMPK